MAATKGNDCTLNLSTTAIGEVVSYDCNVEIEVIDDSSLLDEWKTHQGGVKSWGGSFKVWFDEDDTSQNTIMDALLAASSTGTVSNMRPNIKQGSTSDGYLNGSVIMSKISFSNPGIGGIIEMNADFVGTGAVAYTDSV